MADHDFPTAIFEAAGFCRMPKSDEIGLIFDALSKGTDPQRIVDELAAGLAYVRSFKGDGWDPPHLNMFLHRLAAAKQQQPADDTQQLDDGDRQGSLI